MHTAVFRRMLEEHVIRQLRGLQPADVTARIRVSKCIDAQIV